MTKYPKTSIRLTAEDRAVIARLREGLGLRTTTDTIRLALRELDARALAERGATMSTTYDPPKVKEQLCRLCQGSGDWYTWGKCPECHGTGENPDEQTRWQCREQAIANTGYRESGAEMADQMQRQGGLPQTVKDEYRRLCRKAGVTP